MYKFHVLRDSFHVISIHRRHVLFQTGFSKLFAPAKNEFSPNPLSSAISG